MYMIYNEQEKKSFGTGKNLKKKEGKKGKNILIKIEDKNKICKYFATIDKGYVFINDNPLLNKTTLDRLGLFEEVKHSNDRTKYIEIAGMKLGENEGGKKVTDITDKKLADFINKEIDKIGLVSIYSGYENDNPSFDVEFDLPLNSLLSGPDRIACGKSKDNTWYAQYCIRTDIDDYAIETYEFTEKPDSQKINIAKIIETIQSDYRLGKDFIFRCQECGSDNHFVDIPESDINKKWNLFRDSYCGC